MQELEELLSGAIQQTHNKMVFQGEDVPLTESILKEKIEFFQTKAEWSAKNQNQILRSLSANGAFFTPSINETLWLTSAWCSVFHSAAGAAHAHVLISIENRGTGATTHILGASIDHIVGQHGGADSNSISFPMPLKIEHPFRVILTTTGATTNETGGIQGWVEPRRVAGR